jgi:hypothetical protein
MTNKVTVGGLAGSMVVAMALMIGCSSETDSSNERSGDRSDQSDPNEQGDQVAESSDALHNGLPCRAVCKSNLTGWRYCYYNRKITSDCRTWAINTCKAHDNSSFVDASWSSESLWGNC